MFEPQDAMRQASMTADEYMSQAITWIDKRLGTGYAKKNPALIAAFMNTAARDYHDSVLTHKEKWA